MFIRSLCVVGVVIIDGQRARCFKVGKGRRKKRSDSPLLSPIPAVTAAMCPEGGQRSAWTSGNLRGVRCEAEGNHDRRPRRRGWRGWQVTSCDGWGKSAEGGWTVKKKSDGERDDRWLLQWEWQEVGDVEGRQKKGWESALIFHTGLFLHTWREGPDSPLIPLFTLTLSFLPYTSLPLPAKVSTLLQRTLKHES